MASAWLNFDAIRARASATTILAHYRLSVVHRGKQNFIRCPFHHEATPSCSVDLLKGIFHCFGCGAKGNMIGFVAQIERTDARSAAAIIAEICALEPMKCTPEATAARWATNSREATNSPRPAVRELQLEATHPFLASRALSADAVVEFGLGYCGRGAMRGRICFPIHDAAGHLVAYAGRWASDRVPEGIPRYLLSAGFQKRQVLYNLHRTNPGDALVVVEGFWSVIRLHGLGVPTVALMGTSMSSEHVEVLRSRGSRDLTLLMDGDEAGWSARERALPVLAEHFRIRAPKLPRGEKPDSFSEERLRNLLQL